LAFYPPTEHVYVLFSFVTLANIFDNAKMNWITRVR